MGDAAGDGGLVGVAFEVCRNRLAAGGAGKVTAVEHAILGVDEFGIGRGAGIGARRVTRDQIVDFEPILDGAKALFKRWRKVAHTGPQIMIDARLCAAAEPTLSPS